MPKYPYRLLGSFFDRVFRNGLNDNFKDVETDIKEQKDRIDNLVLSAGDSVAEVIDLRVDNAGVSHPLAKDRFDADAESVQAQFTDVNNKIGIIKAVKLYIEDYPRQGAETDDTERIKRAIAAAPEFATLIFNPLVTYYLTSVPITKSLNLNLNGAKFIVDPTTAIDPGTGNMVKGNPAFHFKGSEGTKYNLSSAVNDSNTVTLTTAGDASNFAVGDYVIIEDSTPLPKFDGSAGATGLCEINKVAGISGGVITLMRNLEWDYLTTPTIRKMTPLKAPKIYGAANITEVDPGFAYSGGGLTAFAPHIIHFQWCVMPEVKDCHFDKWQLHAVNFHYCVFPKLSNSTGKNAFRPSTAGTGYFMRFERCIGGVTEHCEATNVRHMVDFVMAYDCLSFANKAYDMKFPPYAWHGNNSKRCNSLNDTAIGGTADIAFCVGNPSFAGDYDVTITNPTYRGDNKGIVVQCKSERVQIITPYIKSNSTGIVVSSGAGDVHIEAGRIAITGTADTTKAALIVRPKNALADSVGYATGKVTMNGTKIKGVGQILLVDDFDFTYTNMDMEMTNAAHESAIHTQTAIDPVRFVLRGGTLKGTMQKYITVYRKPTKRYEVANIEAEGATVQRVNMLGESNLRFVDNDFTDAVAYNIYGANAATGTYRANKPATTWG